MKIATLIVLLALPWSGWSATSQPSDPSREPSQGISDKKDQPGTAAQSPEKKRLTNADVIGMVKAGLAESTIVLAVQHSATNFDTSPQELISLKNQGVPQKVLDTMLTARTEKTTEPTGPTDRAAISGTGDDDNGRWEVSEEVSPMDGERTVVLSLRAEQGIPGSVGVDKFPRLIIRCKSKHQMDAYVHTGSLPFDADRRGRYAVRLRLDDGQPFTQYWDESTSYDSLFAPKPGEFAKQLRASRKLAFEFTPLGSGPVATWFDLAGLEGPLGKVANACGWSGQGTSTESGTPDLHSIRNVFVETDDSMHGYLEKHTCLQIVDTLRAADAIFAYTTSAFFGKPHYKLLTKDGRVIWEHSGLRFLGPLNDALGCPH